MARGTSPAATDDSNFAARVHQIGSAVDTSHAMETMRKVWENDRWFTFDRFHATALYLKSRLQESGLRDIELLDAPADGVTRAGHWTMPLAWDVRHAQLEIIAPAPNPEFRILADYEKVARRTDELVTSLPDLDLAHPLPNAPWFPPGEKRSARRVFLHIIAETTQHAGHADIIRESLDGAKSMG